MKAYSWFFIVYYLARTILICNAFQITLGGRSVSYNGETGVLRIQLKDPSRAYNLVVPPLGTLPSDNVINSIQVKDTGIEGKGFGAFATREIAKNTFLQFYEGDIIKSRESLDAVITERASLIRQSNGKSWKETNAMDYVMSLDGGVTFIDGFER